MGKSYRKALEVAALIAVALNLRPAIASVGPVLELIRAELGMSRTTAGLLTTLPVLCMGLLAPLAGRWSARHGPETTVLWAVIFISVATLLRATGSAPTLFVTAFIAGCGIAIASPLLGSFIKLHFPERAAAITGLYTTALALGAAMSAGLAAPLAEVSGGSWHLALSVWGLLALLATVLWWPVVRRSPAPAISAASHTTRLPWRSGKAWLLMLLFGLQSQVFYAVLTWLAPMYADLGWSEARAGGLLSILLLTQLASSLLISMAANRRLDRRPWLLASGVAALISLLGLAVEPQWHPWLWMALLGAGTGGLFALSMTLPLDYGTTPADAGSWTAMMLFGGYLISATGPFIGGLLRDVTGSYASVFATLSAVAAIVVAVSAFMGPPRRHPDR